RPQRIENESAVKRTTEAIGSTSGPAAVCFKRAERRVIARRIEGRLRDVVVVHSEAATEDHLLVVYIWTPGKTKSRSEIGLIHRVHRVSRYETSIGIGRRSIARQHEIAQQVVGLEYWRVVLVP